MDVYRLVDQDHDDRNRVFTEILSPYFQLANQIDNKEQYYDYNLYCKYETKAKTEGRDIVLKDQFKEIEERGLASITLRRDQQENWKFLSRLLVKDLQVIHP